MIQIIRPADLARALAALCEAFAQNKSVLQMTGGHAPKTKYLMQYALDTCAECGKVLSDDSGQAFALVLFPDRQQSSLKSLWQNLVLVFKVTGLRRLFNVLAREQLLRETKTAQLVTNPQYYLWFICVKDAGQARGYGTALLRELMADATLMRRTLVLETSTEANLSFYWKAGLECYEVLETGFSLYCFRSEA